MGIDGRAALLTNGKRGLAPNGKGSLFGAAGTCDVCCTLEPYVLATYITNSQNPVWDLTPYQGDSIGRPGTYWRLIEVGTCFPINYPWYGAGCVDATGELVGLPNDFTTTFSHDGFMELQIGILAGGGTITNWPGTCRTTGPVFAC